MSRACQVTGKEAAGRLQRQSLEPSHQAALRDQPQGQAVLARDENRWITIRVSARGMRRIDKLGLPAVIAEMRARGEKI